MKGRKRTECDEGESVEAMIKKKRRVKRLLIAPLLIAIAGLLGWLSKITSTWQLIIATVILAVPAIYAMAYATLYEASRKERT